ncbi:hypothetical protein SLE2022_379700 [Rubroshorea leprosula]
MLASLAHLERLKLEKQGLGSRRADNKLLWSIGDELYRCNLAGWSEATSFKILDLEIIVHSQFVLLKQKIISSCIICMIYLALFHSQYTLSLTFP